MLLHRTTRSQPLTELGNVYLLRSPRVLVELDGAEAEAAELLGHAAINSDEVYDRQIENS